jgi:hypothetical protein
VERCHAFLSQFGRIARRFDRLAHRYLAWVQLAAFVIFICHDATTATLPLFGARDPPARH